MENTNKSAFQFKDYKIKKSLIEIESGKFGESLEIMFQPKGVIKISESTYTLELSVFINDKSEGLNIEVVIISDFVFDNQIDKSQLQKYFYINAPAIIFPYIRAYISTLTALSGINPIILPTLNLSSLGLDLEKNTVEIQ